MERLQFNFNNEANILTLNRDEETGLITVPSIENSPAFTSIEEFAHNYAIARDVKPEHLKNWVLTTHGEVYTFVLRAGTAGVVLADAILDALRDEGFDESDIEEFVDEIAYSDDLMGCLEDSTCDAIAEFVKDYITGGNSRQTAEGAALAIDPETGHPIIPVTVEALSEFPEDALPILAYVLGLPADATIDAICDAADMGLRQLYNEFYITFHELSEKCNTNSAKLITCFLKQEVVFEADNALRDRAIAIAAIAGRSDINVNVWKIGETRMINEPAYVPASEFAQMDTYAFDTVPTVFVFDTSIDVVEDEVEASTAADAEVTE